MCEIHLLRRSPNHHRQNRFWISSGLPIWSGPLKRTVATSRRAGNNGAEEQAHRQTRQAGTWVASDNKRKEKNHQESVCILVIIATTF